MSERLCITVAAALWLTACRATPPSRGVAASPAYARVTPASAAVQRIFRASLDSLAATVDTFAQVARMPATRPEWARANQDAFVKARMAYKRIEVLFELEAGPTALELNGAAVPETEENDGVRTSNRPTGFQVIEEMLFPEVSLEDSSQLRYEVELAQSLVVRARALAGAGGLTESNLFDAVRLEIARVSVISLANADSPIAERGLVEGATALDGLVRLLAPIAAEAARRAPVEWSSWERALSDAATPLRATNEATVERLDVTRRLLIPLAHRWNDVRAAMQVALPPDGRAWRADVASIFDADALDAWQFAPAYTRSSQRDSAAALGRALFTDVRLSANGSRSCVTCHQPQLAFTDGLARSQARDGVTRLRNAPTLINAALQRLQFADARAVFLEDQVTDVVESRHELGGALQAYAKRLRADPVSRARFARSFGDAGDSTVTPLRVAQALAAYERSLVALNSPFDRYVRGDSAAMSPLARRGYNVFMGKGKCGTCHFAPLFNGTVPPQFLRSETEVLGTPSSAGWSHLRLDSDSGRARTYSAPAYLRAFKTPTVRNAARTAPYMHNGVYQTLQDVIEFYNRGGGVGLGLSVPNQTLPTDPLRLTGDESRALIAFITSLNDSPQ